jgi:hypothetical protein
MRSVQSAPLLAVLLVLAAATPAALRAEFVLFKNVWGDVIVSTDTTEAGKAVPPPSPQQPIYYTGLSLGPRLGSIPGDQEPDIKQMNLFVARILAKQGYLGARPDGPEPELFVVLQWGYLTPGSENLLWFLGYNPADDIAAPTFPGKLGAEVFRRGMRSRLIETILQDSEDAIYGIIVTAFEFKTARTAEPVARWQTRIGLPANGKSMTEALPVMLTAAGPAIGRPADKPVLVDADAVREGQVKLGELKFLDFENELPPADGAVSGKN